MPDFLSEKLNIVNHEPNVRLLRIPFIIFASIDHYFHIIITSCYEKNHVVHFIPVNYVSSFTGGLDTKSDSLRKDALAVYMEANDYIRKEIPYINYVRDIRDASVYILTK